MPSTPPPEPVCAPASLPARWWARAGARLVARALGELSYEELLTPVPVRPGRYRLLLGSADYTFDARRDRLTAWHVEADSVRRHGRPVTDLARFFLDAREAAGLDAATLAEIVREATATQTAEARVLAGALPAADLLELDYAELEQHLGGHPVLVLNKGRVGLDADDAAQLTPEARGTLTLTWYAAHPDLASWAGLPGLDRAVLLAEELDPRERATFTAALTAAGPHTDRYVWFPVHPYQDATVVRTLFAGELAAGRLLRLGRGVTAYRPVQSVRSLVGPGRRDVKTAMLMRNTLVWRGLGGAATRAAPAVSAWLGRLHAGDPQLQATGLAFLREVASVSVRHPHYAALAGAPYRYGELLGAVWREPVAAHLAGGERARSLASLLHVDPDGRALVAELVTRSGLEVEDWLRHLFRALFPGLLLCLTRHGVAFCPHGENTVVVFRDEVAARVLIKDFAEDVTLLPGRSYPALPPQADEVLVRWPLPELAHSIISAILTGHFRYLAPLLHDQTGLDEDRFWSLVRAELLRWRAGHPDLADAFDALGLLAPRFERIALNREQLSGGGFHDRADRDAEPDLTHGHLPNPLFVKGERC